MESNKRKKFDNNLLNQLMIKDNALLLGDYDILTQNSIINYKCKCGNNHFKKFRGIFNDGGAFCKECCKINQIEKTKLTFNSEKRKSDNKKTAGANRLSNDEINRRLKEKYKNIDIININEFKNVFSKLNYKCNICNLEFTRSIRSTINNGCPTCKGKIIKSKIYSTSIYNDTNEKRKENFINNLEKLHPNLYEYSNINYINKDTKITLGCLKCKGKFDILPCQLLNKNKKHIVGCQKCNNKQRTIDRCISKELIEETLNKTWKIIDWLNYSKQRDKIKVKCIKCNIEKLLIVKNSLKKGCINCYNNRRGDTCKLTKEVIIKRFKNIWNNTYDYSKVEYTNIFSAITIICKKHGEFSLVAQLHQRGSGCPKCYPTTELYVLDYLKNYYPTIISQFKLDSCKNKIHLPFDYCIPELKTIIELDGGQHFKQVGNWKSCELQLERDIYKMNKADQEGYKIIRITQMDVFKYKEKWLENNLLPEIKSTDRNHIFISSDDTIYDKHIEIFETS